jgi:DNA-binding NtrC family response regulator
MHAGNETILLVDDSAPLLKLMRQFLADSGYTVLDTGDPAEALRMAAEHHGPIPLLITDMVLPGFNGTVLAEELIAARPETKVLYISGYNGDPVVPSRAFGQAYDFLVKPFTQKELLAKARQLLDSSHIPSPERAD